MSRKIRREKIAVEPKVSWVHVPDPAAEAEFWKLYLRLVLQGMAKDNGISGAAPEEPKGPGENFHD